MSRFKARARVEKVRNPIDLAQTCQPTKLRGSFTTSSACAFDCDWRPECWADLMSWLQEFGIGDEAGYRALVQRLHATFGSAPKP